MNEGYAADGNGAWRNELRLETEARTMIERREEMPNPWGALGAQADGLGMQWAGASLPAEGVTGAGAWAARAVRSEGWREEYVLTWNGAPQGSLWLPIPTAALADRLVAVLNASGVSGSRALVHELGMRIPTDPIRPLFLGARGGLWQCDDAGDARVREAGFEELERRFGAVQTVAAGTIDPDRILESEAALCVTGLGVDQRTEWLRNWSGTPDRMAGSLRGLLSPASRIRLGEPMARRTSMRVGGAADLWVEPGDEGDLQRTVLQLNEWGVDWVVVGAGTNLIVSDAGIGGVVLRLSGPGFQRLYAGREGVRAGAGVFLRHIVRAAAEAGRSGLEFFEGIPGTVGGALRMNAGAMGREFFDVLETVRFMERSGAVDQRPGGSFEVGYRHCPFFQTHIGLEVRLGTEPGVSSEVGERVQAFLERRKRTQPVGPSAGCIFRNPAPGQSAGQLIDQAGLKGAREGGAVVSEIHGNFIVNEGHASAEDLVRLIERVRNEIRRRYGVELEQEVIYLGRMDQGEGRR